MKEVDSEITVLGGKGRFSKLEILQYLVGNDEIGTIKNEDAVEIAKDMLGINQYDEWGDLIGEEDNAASTYYTTEGQAIVG